MNNIERMRRYYRRREEIHREIRRYLRTKGKKCIVYGGRALNEHLPSYLDRHTEDWDIYSRKPRVKARRLEKRLDKHFGGDYFKVVPAQHKGTYKIKSNVTKTGIADFTKPEKKVKCIRKQGICYVPLKTIEKGIKKTLKDKSSKFRWDKDREALNRIKIYKSLRKRYGSKKAKSMMISDGLVSLVKIPKLRTRGLVKW